MSFFKDFKEDFSQAVNELTSPEGQMEPEEEMVVNTLEQDMDAKAEMDKLGGLLERVEEPVKKPEPVADRGAAARSASRRVPEPQNVPERAAEPAPVPERPAEQAQSTPRRAAVNPAPERVETQETNNQDFEIDTIGVDRKEMKEEDIMNTEEMNVQDEAPVMESHIMSTEVSDEVTVITEGTALTGNIESTGSIEIRGKVTGNVHSNGKLTVNGIVKGNSSASEFFADSAKIEGEINTEGTVKIGLGSVVVGNITATSAVIAGAIKGDIDVRGPVVVDTSAVVMGNIKSRSVQINNGAVIEGFCSQCYAEVDVAKLFDENK